MIASLVPLGILVLIIFAIAAGMEGKNTMKKSNVIRSLYFYMASAITLAIVVGSLVYLVNMGLKTWVFTKADTSTASRIGPPPTLVLDPNVVMPSDKVAPFGGELVCTDACTLTTVQKDAIASWKIEYQNWLDVNANPGSQRARDAVAALSFLIVAAPFYFIHFRTVQRDAKTAEDGDKGVIRPVYFYFVSLAALIMIVVAGGFLINLGLKTWVFPSAGQADIAAQKAYSAPVMTSAESGGVPSVVTCGEACGIDPDTIALAERWSGDYATWNKEISGTTDSTQRQAATAIPFVLVGIPLFWYHWTVVRREAKERKEQSTPAN
ncbi:MAG: DUF5671 domain-containing protein [Patescibacteria group bacterium]